MTPSILDHFEDAIMPVTESGCWIWMKACTKRGYGSAKFGGVNWRMHRLSWQISNGQIADGVHILHRCDIPQCVNPDHLFPGTHVDNMQDKERKGRGNHAMGLRNGRHTKPESTARGDRSWRKNHPESAQGKNNGHAILTEDEVRFIRGSALSGSELGRLFGITKHHANRIKAGKAWRHL